jgi:hypothetical protein
MPTTTTYETAVPLFHNVRRIRRIIRRITITDEAWEYYKPMVMRLAVDSAIAIAEKRTANAPLRVALAPAVPVVAGGGMGHPTSKKIKRS